MGKKTPTDPLLPHGERIWGLSWVGIVGKEGQTEKSSLLSVPFLKPLGILARWELGLDLTRWLYCLARGCSGMCSLLLPKRGKDADDLSGFTVNCTPRCFSILSASKDQSSPFRA